AWFGCIVEGDGEVQALPVLIRKIASRIDPGLSIHIPRPVKLGRARMDARSDDLERMIRVAMTHLQPPRALLVLLDADDDPDPTALASRLLVRVEAARSDVPSAVVVAVREYEAWFLAAAESLAGRRGLPDGLLPPPNPEAIRDAKGWLRDRSVTDT